jgi:hypothetical protein
MEFHMCFVKVRKPLRGMKEKWYCMSKDMPNQESPKTRGKHVVASPTHTPILNMFALLTRITKQKPRETGIQVITGGSEMTRVHVS